MQNFMSSSSPRPCATVDFKKVAGDLFHTCFILEEIEYVKTKTKLSKHINFNIAECINSEFRDDV